MISPLHGWGINVTAHDITSSNLEWLLDCVQDLRCEWIRYEFDFRGVVNQQIEERWIEACLQRNLKIVGLLNYSVPGSIQNVFFPELANQCIVNQKVKFFDFIRNIIIKYPDITHWEVLNEPNTKRFWIKQPNHSEYVAFLQNVSELIKTIQSNATIIMAGLMGDNELLTVPFQERYYYQKCIQAGAGEYFSASNFHPYIVDCYVSFKSYKAMLASTLNALKKTTTYAKGESNHPIWFTEFGISPWLVRVSQKEIAEIYKRSYLFCQSQGIPLFIWELYDVKKSPVNPLSPEAHFGLLDHHFEPKETFKQLVHIMK